MSIEVALVDFPRIQEQIATRLLADYNATVHPLTHGEAAERLSMFNLALYFWPDSGREVAQRLRALKSGEGAQSVPVVLVTSEVGRRAAEAVIGPDGAVDLLVTPLQPHVVSRKLAALLGVKRDTEPPRMDAAHITPFVDGTVDTLKQMAGMSCTRTNLSLRMDGHNRGDISGTMGLLGKTEGFVAVVFREALARKLVCRMLQINPGEETDEDIRDGVGELMNIIAGAAKAELANTEHSFSFSLPAVIVGGPHTVGQIRGVPVVVIAFDAEGDAFEVMVCMVPNRRA